MLPVSLKGAMRKASNNGIRRQLLKWSLVGLVLVPTVFLWLLVGSSFFGYRLVSVHGTSMQPALCEGDALLMKYRKSLEIETGSIVTLQDLGQGWITHRLITVQPFSKENYLLKTRGDDNACPEYWIVGKDEKVLVSHARISLAGYVLDFLGSIPGTLFLISVIVSLVIVRWVRRSRKAPKGEHPLQSK